MFWEKAGSLTTLGYCEIGLGGERYYAHRIIWLLKTGSWPKGQVDHLNHDKFDNRFENLREVPHQSNCKNLGLRVDNISGITGVTWHKQGKKWMANVGVDGKTVYLGLYTDITDAAAAVQKFYDDNNFHENHGKQLRAVS
jgi:hypothetical protein